MHKSSNILICAFNDDVIILNINADEFYIIDDGLKIPRDDLIKEINCHFQCNFNDDTKISSLLSKAEYGYLDMRWMGPKYKKVKTNILTKILSVIQMARIKKEIDRGGFNVIQRNLLKDRKKFLGKKPRHEKGIDLCNSIILNSMKFFSIKNPCLIYSHVLTKFMIKNGVNAKLVVGVRTRPFHSHAWVEVNNKVIGDDVDLRKKLSVIVEI